MQWRKDSSHGGKTCHTHTHSQTTVSRWKIWGVCPLDFICDIWASEHTCLNQDAALSPGERWNPTHPYMWFMIDHTVGCLWLMAVFRIFTQRKSLPVPELLPLEPVSLLGPKPGTLPVFKDTVKVWEKGRYQSPCWMASVIIIFISIKGSLRQGIVKFNLVRIRTQQGLIFYFCLGWTHLE